MTISAMYEYGGFSWRRAPGFLGISEFVGLHISGSKLVSCCKPLAFIGNTFDRAATVDEFGCTTTVCSCWCRLESDSFFIVASRTLSASRSTDGTMTLWSIEISIIKVRSWRTSYVAVSFQVSYSKALAVQTNALRSVTICSSHIEVICVKRSNCYRYSKIKIKLGFRHFGATNSRKTFGAPQQARPRSWIFTRSDVNCLRDSTAEGSII